MNFLDTDTLSLLLAGHPAIVEKVRQSERVATTIVSRIEILQGRFASILKAADQKQLLQAQHWLHENERYMNQFDIVDFDPDAAAMFDQLRQNKKLRKIGRPDLLIASITLAADATVITRNLKHFKLVPNLRVENWAD